MIDSFQHGQDVGGAVVIESLPVPTVRLRCPCDATFTMPHRDARKSIDAGEKLLCPGCTPTTGKPKRARSEPLSKTPVAAEVLRMRAEGYGYHAISVSLNLERNKVYQILRDAKAIAPLGKFRATRK